MNSPTPCLRDEEDLKVILITKDIGKRLTRAGALRFFAQYGKVKNCWILSHDNMACGVYTTEEDAEEALKVGGTVVDGAYCNVTTFKSGNRKVYINSSIISEKFLIEYLELNYGTVLRVEWPGNLACFVLFLNVDAAVKCRDREHTICGHKIFVRPGNTPGSKHYKEKTNMYHVPTSNWQNPQQQVTKSSFSGLKKVDLSSMSSLGIFSRNTFLNPRPSLSSSPSCNTNPINCHLLHQMKNLSLEEKNVSKKNKKVSDTLLDWRNGPGAERVSPTRVISALDEKLMRLEKKRKELNLPDFNPCAHYSRDEEGFPIHHNGQYVHSIMKDGRFRIKEDRVHVSFNTEKNIMEIFERAEYEYSFFGPINPTNKSGIVQYDDEEIEGWGNETDEQEPKRIMPREGFPHDIPWPINFPTMPHHYPLMDNCTFPNDCALLLSSTKRYVNHLEDRWKNTRQDLFLTQFASFLRTECTVCATKLEGPKKFTHLITNPHLSNLNDRNVKYTASDFIFWHTLLLKNFDNGGKRR
ncbi:hypothetical protein PENTCL1PPCAC_6798 [Pristionchus entomophagus]|uniref:RRM domain-containing protein n=1 Tax=Pristionchus entomophagus TaxID=358040 RepID=A0AAV5SR69_9BILA|nr:hypothetical protein PENTCL1PPCAC_6798 [Pristionchus entomophagus]